MNYLFLGALSERKPDELYRITLNQLILAFELWLLLCASKLALLLHVCTTYGIIQQLYNGVTHDDDEEPQHAIALD